MSDGFVIKMEELWVKLETAREEWNDYLTSISSKAAASESEEGTKPSIATRCKKIDQVAADLQQRLDVTNKLKATQSRRISATHHLLASHLPQEIRGPETANSLFVHAIERTESDLAVLQRYIGDRESVVTERFSTLEKNYESVIHIITSREVCINAVLKSRRYALGMERVIEEDGGVDGFSEETVEKIREGAQGLDAFMAIIERQVLQFMANIRFVGVEVPRQRLITEFLESEEEEEEE